MPRFVFDMPRRPPPSPCPSHPAARFTYVCKLVFTYVCKLVVFDGINISICCCFFNLLINPCPVAAGVFFFGSIQSAVWSKEITYDEHPFCLKPPYQRKRFFYFLGNTFVSSEILFKPKT